MLPVFPNFPQDSWRNQLQRDNIDMQFLKAMAAEMLTFSSCCENNHIQVLSQSNLLLCHSN